MKLCKNKLHEMTPDNTRIDYRGWERCILCVRATRAKYNREVRKRQRVAREAEVQLPAPVPEIDPRIATCRLEYELFKERMARKPARPPLVLAAPQYPNRRELEIELLALDYSISEAA